MKSKEAEGLLGCIVVPAVVAFFLYALWPSQTERREWKETVAEIDAEVQAEQRVGTQLRDPSSATYSDNHSSKRMPGVVCGSVNAANGLGGKSGNQRYITTAADTIFEETIGSEEMDRAWANLC